MEAQVSRNHTTSRCACGKICCWFFAVLQLQSPKALFLSGKNSSPLEIVREVRGERFGLAWRDPRHVPARI